MPILHLSIISSVYLLNRSKSLLLVSYTTTSLDLTSLQFIELFNLILNNLNVKLLVDQVLDISIQLLIDILLEKFKSCNGIFVAVKSDTRY